MRRLSTINSQLNVSNLNIALLPLRITWGDKSANLDAVAQAMQQLHPAPVLLVLPETFSTGFPAGMDKETVRPLAERNTGSTIERVKELTRQHSVGIAGSFIADSGAVVVSEDSLGDEYVKAPTTVLNQWTYHARLYAAARYITTQQDMNLVQLVSFGCGVDAITTDEVRSIMEKNDKLYTQIKIDEINNLGVVKIRLRSMLAAIEEGKKFKK